MERRRKAADLLLAAEHEYYLAMRDDRTDDTARLRRVQARAALELAEREAERVLAEHPVPDPCPAGTYRAVELPG